jgi:acyl carrier protein
LDNKRKIELLKDVFETDEILPEMELKYMESWDSMTKLALIVMVEDKFGKIMDNKIIKSLSSINDIMNHMN